MKILLLFFFWSFSFLQCYGQIGLMRWENDGLAYGNEFDVISIPEHLNDEVNLNSSSFIPAQIENAHNLKIVNIVGNNYIADWNDAFLQLAKTPNIKEIDLSRNLFEELPQSTANLNQVEELALKACHHLDFEQAFEVLKGMENLKKLSLNNNNFVQIPENLKLLQQLEELDLSDNPHLDYQYLFSIIAQMPNLRALYLKRNEPQKTPLDLDKIKHLETLSFSSNENLDIATLITALKDFKQLKKLDLGFMSIKELPSSIGDLVYLEELNIQYNQLAKLPTTIQKLKKLKILSLATNSFKNFPKEVCALKTLERLEVSSRDQVKFSIPEEFKNLTNLEYFDIKNNVLTNILIPFYKNFPKYKSIHNLNIRKDETISAAIKHMNQLEEVTISFYDGANIEESLAILAKNKAIKSLKLRFNGEVILPPTIGDHNNLEELRLYSLSKQKIKLPKEIGNLKSLKKLILGGLLLDNLPNEITNLQQLDSLVLLGTGLTSLPDSIGNLKSLRYLNIFACSLKTLPKSIGKLKNLEFLDIGSSKLQKNIFFEFPNEFGNCQSLKVLSATQAKIKSLPSTFRKLNKLEFLDLRANDLTELPASFGELTNLKFLDLMFTELTSLPSSFDKLQNLQYLTLELDVTFFPKEITRLSKLRYLSIYIPSLLDSPLDFPQEIENLSSLTVFNIKRFSETNWASLCQKLGKLKQLKIVSLNMNEDFPNEIHYLQAVKKLTLVGGTSFDADIQLPKGLGLLGNLQSLEISNQNIKEFPQNLIGLKSLHSLILSCSKLNWESTFTNLGAIPNFKILEIEYCKLSKLPNSIKTCKALEVLDVSGHNLSELPNELIELQNLKTLDLSNNKLTELPNELHKLKKLTNLYLNNNKLNDLPISLIYLKNLRNLNLSGNPIPEKIIDFYKKNTTAKNVEVRH